MNIKIRNFYYLIAGILAMMFAVTHAWNGQSAILPMLNVEAISDGSRTVFTYVWHIITAENLVFGLAFIIMSFQVDGLKTRFTAWLIVAVLMVRLLVIIGITALLYKSGLTDTLIDSVAIIIYVFLIVMGTRIKKNQF